MYKPYQASKHDDCCHYIERKQMDKLRLQSERLKGLVEHLPAGAIYVDNNRLTLNRAAETLTGYKRKDLQTLEQWFEKLYGKRSKKIQHRYELDRAAGFPKKTQPMLINHANGDNSFIEFTGYRYDNHEVWLMQDVSKRHHYEKTLKQSEERLRAIMDNAAESIVVIDAAGLITDYNLAAEKLFGYNADEAIGHNVSMLMPSPHRERHDSYIANYLTTGISHIMDRPREMPGVRKDGSIFPLELTVTKIDHIGLFSGIIRDLSERKLLEKEIADISTLEQERIGQDIHDSLGQQLTGLGLMAASLKRELIREKIPKNEQLDEVINHIQKATMDARQLSRGLVPLSIETLGLEDAIKILTNDIQNTTGINCYFEAPQPVNISDHTISIQIYRIVQEAVNNAVKHADASNIHINLSNTDRVEFSISDDGKGFDLSDKKLNNSLGLRIMRYRAGVIGCKLDIESTPGTGTVVNCKGIY